MAKEFNLEEHKKNHVNYLEVVIFRDGRIEYAVPSHIEKIYKIVCDKLQISRETLWKGLEGIRYYLEYLYLKAGIISVWYNYTYGFEYTEKQIETLKMLKREGVYIGDIPEEPFTRDLKYNDFDKLPSYLI